MSARGAEVRRVTHVDDEAVANSEIAVLVVERLVLLLAGATVTVLAQSQGYGNGSDGVGRRLRHAGSVGRK